MILFTGLRKVNEWLKFACAGHGTEAKVKGEERSRKEGNARNQHHRVGLHLMDAPVEA
jgi:hypothetical protein